MAIYLLNARKTGIALFFIIFIFPVSAQYSLGMTGLLNTPDANMQKDGIFLAGANYLPKEMLPATWDYNTGNYFVNITFFPFVEVAYRLTLLKSELPENNNWQQDRSVSLRLRPLKERRYIPSVVIGSNDVLTTYELNVFKSTNSNRYFSSIYAVATKNIDISDNIFSITAGGYFFSKNDLYKGVFGGIKYTPSFLKQVSVIAEYDSNCVNAGVAALLFKHFSLHAFTYDMKAFSCGLRYEFCLLQ